jgi:hypothetical protein
LTQSIFFTKTFYDEVIRLASEDRAMEIALLLLMKTNHIENSVFLRNAHADMKMVRH